MSKGVISYFSRRKINPKFNVFGWLEVYKFSYWLFRRRNSSFYGDFESGFLEFFRANGPLSPTQCWLVCFLHVEFPSSGYLLMPAAWGRSPYRCHAKLCAEVGFSPRSLRTGAFCWPTCFAYSYAPLLSKECEFLST